MKKARSCPQEIGYIKSVWLKKISIVLVLGIILPGCAPSGPPGGTEPTPSQGAQAPTLAVNPAPYVEPKELPTMGSPEAKVTLTVFCEFV